MTGLKWHSFVIGCVLLLPHAWAAALPFGQVQTGTISSAAQSNTYTFSANANDVVDFTMVATSGSLSPRIRLYNSAGTLLSQAAGNGVSCVSITELNNVTLPTTGTYTLLASDCSDTNTGNYVIYAQRTNNPAGATALPFGQVQTGTISSAAQSNSYTFSANANDVVDFTMVVTSGSLSPRIRLYNSAGTLLSQAAGNGVSCVSITELNNVTLPTTGTYTLQVGDCTDANAGNYVIHAQRTNNPTGATALPFGQVQTGAISSAAQSNSYTFSANANDVIDFTMVVTSGSLSPRIRLYNPTGVLVSQAAGNGVSCVSITELNNVTLPTAGTYTLLAGDCSDTNTGNYVIYAQRTNNPTGATALAFGQVQTGAIGSAAQSNSYILSASAKDVIDFTMVVTSGSLSPRIRLYSPAGALVSQAAGNGVSCVSTTELNNVTLPTTGAYTLLVGDCTDANTGNYNLSTQCFGVCAAAGGASFIASPAALSFSATPGGPAPPSQTITLTSSTSGLAFTASASATWLSVSPTSGSIPAQAQVSVNSAGLGQGTYQGTITITVPNANPASATISVTLVVAGSGPATSVDPLALDFSLTQGAAAATQIVTIGNHSGQTQSFLASATVNSGANWLSVSPGSGTIPALGSATILAAADPSNLQPGTYSGTITIAIAGGQSFTVSVLATVAGSQPNMVLSASGLRFQAIIGGSATPPQTVTVLNSGPGTLNFSVKVSTISGGSWLSVSPASGASAGSSTSSATFTANASGLAAGDYYGQATFSAPGAANSPQVVSVVLNVLSPANSPGVFVQPAGLIFIAAAGGANPAAQTLSISNPSPNAVTFLATAFTSNGSNSLTLTPASGSVSATQSASISVQPSLQGLTPGLYIADLVLNIVSAPSPTIQTLHIEVVLLILPAGGSSSATAELRPNASNCTPTKLIPVFTQLEAGFSTAAAWPTDIEVTVVDDCGTPLTSGSVSATFSNGDPALSLASLKDGRWSATWEPGNKTSAVTVTAQAQEAQPPLTGSQAIGGALTANPVAPAVNTGGILNAASYASNQPLAPGSFAAIFGTNLSQSLNQSLQLPLSTQLAGTSVVMGGEQLPLLFTSSGQINAVVPYDLPLNSTQQLIVQMGSAISIPQPVAIAPAQPAVFTFDASGSGPATIQAYKPDGTQLPLKSPVTGGYVIVIYCTGLGAVNPAVPAGSQAPPAGPLSNTVNQVTATIGGMSAQVLFAGLSPGSAQLYQVNVVVPTGLPSGNASVLLTENGQQSAPGVTIPIQ